MLPHLSTFSTLYLTEILDPQTRADNAKRELHEKQAFLLDGKHPLGDNGGTTPGLVEGGMFLMKEGEEEKEKGQEGQEGLVVGHGGGMGAEEGEDRRGEEGQKEEEVEEKDFAFGTLYRTLFSPVARVSPGNKGCPHPALFFAEHARIAQQKVWR